MTQPSTIHDPAQRFGPAHLDCYMKADIRDGAAEKALLDALEREELDWATRLSLVLLLEERLVRGTIKDPVFLAHKLHFANPTWFPYAKRQDPLIFLESLRQRGLRLQRVYALDDPTQRKLAYQWLIDRPCYLTLLPAFIKPEVIVAQILAAVHCCEASNESLEATRLEFEARRSQLSFFEIAVLEGLMFSKKAFWVAPHTPRHHEALVSCPVDTVALILRLPGSDREFEIKRIGFNREHPFAYIFKKEGVAYDKTHRLQGCAMHRELQLEAIAAHQMSHVWRSVEDQPAPMCASFSVTEILTVPWRDEELALLTYLTEERVWGAGFEQHKVELERCASAFIDGEYDEYEVGGVHRNASLCLHYGSPGQTLLDSTSSLRLDRICAYLSAKGAADYLAKLQQDQGFESRRTLAHQVLWEILGGFDIPKGSFDDLDAYLDALFRLPANHKRCQTIYKGMMDTFARFWGSLYAMRGCTRGESFVARNVGIRSRMVDDRWQPEILFMDHDDMHLQKNWLRLGYEPRLTLIGFRLDRMYILGHEGEGIRGSLSYLAEIYRIPADQEASALERFKAALADSYWQTTQAMATGQLDDAFDITYLRSGALWDGLVAGFMAAREADDIDAWREAMAQQMAVVGYLPLEIDKHLDTMVKFGDIYTLFPALIDGRLADGSGITGPIGCSTADDAGQQE